MRKPTLKPTQATALTTKVSAYRIFFPLAAIYAALAVPLSVYALSDSSAIFSGLIGIHHGHEMLFGFALALVAGYLLGSLPRWQLALIVGVWIIARFSYVIWPDSLIAAIFSPLFALLLAWYVAPKFLVAKKWRNQALTPLLITIGLFPLVFAIGYHYFDALSLQNIMYGMILLLALLMAYMGGRMIAPAVAGELQKQGITLEARLQPHLEGASIILLSAAALLLVLFSFHVLSGLLVMATGIILAIRLVRWNLWRCYLRPDLIGLGIGYGWLAIGVFLFGLALLVDQYQTAALHVIAVGAIGSLSTGIMVRVHFQRSRRTLPPNAFVIISMSCIGVATIYRALAGLGLAEQENYLIIAAAAWSMAFVTVASQFLPRALE